MPDTDRAIFDAATGLSDRLKGNVVLRLFTKPIVAVSSIGSICSARLDSSTPAPLPHPKVSSFGFLMPPGRVLI